jgi:predicted nucleic acid-binding protein
VRLFDTSFLVDVVRGRDATKTVLDQVDALGERPATTEINAYEILYGAYPGGKLDPRRFAAMQRILSRFDVLPLDRAGAIQAAELSARLVAQGRAIGALDILVAGIALASGYTTIVTRDADFRRIREIRVETY